MTYHVAFQSFEKTAMHSPMRGVIAVFRIVMAGKYLPYINTLR